MNRPMRSSHSHSVDTVEYVKETIPLVLDWLKKVTEADVVIAQFNVGAVSGTNEEELHFTTADARSKGSTSPPQLQELIQSSCADEVTVEGAASNNNNNNNSMVFEFVGEVFQRGRDAGISIIGGNHRKASSKLRREQRSLVEAIAYLLAHSLLTLLTMENLKLRAKESEKQARDLQSKLFEMDSGRANSDSQVNELQSKISTKNGIGAFISRVLASSNMLELSRTVSEVIPTLFLVDSAVLLVRNNLSSRSSWQVMSDVDDSEPEADDLMYVVSNESSAILNEFGERKAISIPRSRKIPPFLQNPKAPLSKMELIIFPSDHPPQQLRNNAPFGVILLFNSSDRRGPSSHPIDENDVRNVSLAVLTSAVRLQQLGTIDALTRSNTQLSTVLESKQHIESDLRSLESVKRELEVEREGLSVEVSGLKNRLGAMMAEKTGSVHALQAEMETARERYSIVEEELRDSVRNLERDVKEMEEKSISLNTNRSAILDLITSFVFDRRCNHSETVLLWLRDTVENMKFTLVTVSILESGDLEGCDQLRGASAAVGEAITAGQVVEFTSSATRTKRKEREAFEVDERDLEVLCVPNRLLSQQVGKYRSECACFLLIRPRSGEVDQYSGLRRMIAEEVERSKVLFSKEEKDILLCAVDLTCRAHFNASQKYSADDFRMLEADLKAERRNICKIRQALKWTEKVFP